MPNPNQDIITPRRRTRAFAAQGGSSPLTPGWTRGSGDLFKMPSSPSPLRSRPVTRRSSMYIAAGERKPGSNIPKKTVRASMINSRNNPPTPPITRRRTSIYQKGTQKMLSPKGIPPRKITKKAQKQPVPKAPSPKKRVKSNTYLKSKQGTLDPVAEKTGGKTAKNATQEKDVGKENVPKNERKTKVVQEVPAAPSLLARATPPLLKKTRLPTPQKESPAMLAKKPKLSSKDPSSQKRYTKILSPKPKSEKVLKQSNASGISSLVSPLGVRSDNASPVVKPKIAEVKSVKKSAKKVRKSPEPVNQVKTSLSVEEMSNDIKEPRQTSRSTSKTAASTIKSIVESPFDCPSEEILEVKSVKKSAKKVRKSPEPVSQVMTSLSLEEMSNENKKPRKTPRRSASMTAASTIKSIVENKFDSLPEITSPVILPGPRVLESELEAVDTSNFVQTLEGANGHPTNLDGERKGIKGTPLSTKGAKVNRKRAAKTPLPNPPMSKIPADEKEVLVSAAVDVANDVLEKINVSACEEVKEIEDHEPALERKESQVWSWCAIL